MHCNNGNIFYSWRIDVPTMFETAEKNPDVFEFYMNLSYEIIIRIQYNHRKESIEYNPIKDEIFFLS